MALTTDHNRVSDSQLGNPTHLKLKEDARNHASNWSQSLSHVRMQFWGQHAHGLLKSMADRIDELEGKLRTECHRNQSQL